MKDDIPQGCIRMDGQTELHIHSVFDPVTRETVAPGPGELVVVNRKFIAGEGLNTAVFIYKGDPRFNFNDPNVELFEGCIAE